MSLVSCGKKASPVAGEPHQKEIEDSFNIFEDEKILFSAVSDSPYAEGILKCALQKDGDDCTPGKVPLLGIKGEVFTPEFILKNTIVSHDFLAKNFASVLKSVSNKYLLNMFASVAGVVITDEISSSFYYSPTGMIYLNATYLWKTQFEFKKLKFKKDRRFARDPRKKIYNNIDFVKNNQVLYTVKRKKERTLDDIASDLTRLLFHELAHAADSYPIEIQEHLDKTKTYYELNKARSDEKLIVSENIGIAYSNKIWEYALFYIDGLLVNPESYVLSREDFIAEFVPNNGLAFYSYKTKREFLAMMMETYFMLFTEGYEVCNSAFYLEDVEKTSELFWFQKNRILQDNVLSDAKKSINLMFPADLAAEMTSLTTERKLETFENTTSTFNELCRNN